MNYFPLFADLHDKAVLVVGAGDAASRKITLLLEAGAKVSVVAPEACEPIQAWVAQGEIQFLSREFKDTDIVGCWLVIAATHQKAVNQQVQHAANEQCTWCNSVDDPSHSEFIVPSMVDRGPVQVAISSGGVAPVLARQIRSQIENLLPQSTGRLAEMLGRWRSVVKQTIKRASQRRFFWENVLSSDVPKFVEQGLMVEAENGMLKHLNMPQDEISDNALKSGHVSLVGAGPGDVELLTIKAQQRLQTADVIFYDALVGEHVLKRARRDAELVYVGKKSGAHSALQEDIQAQLITAAKKGLRVVRLKGGDPFVFGRGGEELHALAQEGISFDVVPGITAAAAAAAYTGVSLTHRDYAQSAILVTGHGKEGGDLDWPSLANTDQTLAIYMGLRQSGEIQEQLIKHGRSAATPIAIIENATRPEQRCVGGALHQLSELVTSHQIKSPAIILVGDVCHQLGRYHWFGSEPLGSSLLGSSIESQSCGDNSA